MKTLLRTIAGILGATLVFVSCATSPPVDGDASAPGDSAAGSEQAAPEQTQAAPRERAPGRRAAYDEAVQVWHRALRAGDRNGLAAAFVDEPTVRYFNETFQRTDFRGRRAAVTFLVDYIDALGLQVLRRPLPEPEEYHATGNGTMYHFRYPFRDDLLVSLRVYLYPEPGVLRVHHIEINIPPSRMMVSNRFQALGDGDGDGFLDFDEEHGRLVEQTRRFYRGPHLVESPVDRFFDANDDGFIDEAEIAAAADLHFRRGMPWGLRFADWLLPRVDADSNGALSRDEVERVVAVVTGQDRPGRRDEFARLAVELPFPDAAYQEVPRQVANYLDDLADRNRDTWIDETEHRRILASLVEHDVVSYEDAMIDLNRDGRVDWHDVHHAMQAAAVGPDALGFVQPPFPVLTLMDGLLDASGDDLVDAAELEAAAAFLAGDPEADIADALRSLVDVDGDGVVTRPQIEEAKNAVILTRVVDSEVALHRLCDVDEDGVLSEQEVGILAGRTSGGRTIAMDERISRYRARIDEASPSGAANPVLSRTNRLGRVSDRRVAVLGVEPGAGFSDEAAGSILTIFVENAFANVTDAVLLDRDHIDKILDEMEMQISGLIDENTAAQIGRHLGADVVVVGTVSSFHGAFYLNIQLLAVETAEILGSSIAQSVDFAEFLDMANQAVMLLF